MQHNISDIFENFQSVHATKNEDAENLQEKLWLYECATCDKGFPYLYSFKDSQICTSVMNEKSFLSSNSDVTL